MSTERRNLKRISVLAAVPAVALATVASGAEQATADTQRTAAAAVRPAADEPPTPPYEVVPRENINEVNMFAGNADEQASPLLAAQYDRMINSFRAATGPIYRQNVRATTTDEHRLVRMRVWRNGSTPVDLIYTADDMYLRGWVVNHPGEPSMLYTLAGDHNNRPFDLGQETGWNPVNVVRTGVPEDYNRLRNLANPSSDSSDYYQPTFGRENFNNALATLDRAQPNQFPRGDQSRVARALLNLTTFTSEAARYSTISAEIHEALATESTTQLSLRNRSLINKWDKMSDYIIDVTNHTNEPPRHINPYVGTMESFDEARHYAAVIHFKPQ
ncbi:ribosome-inactivating family protein [Streptomyces sp. NBC_01231]|nr:ribosome-inactivating family protein [Streptomyces sp. NBC_01231]WSQ15205.1 ribosome-inactivating family protein [Streptomyces sp. NBC_01231]